MRLSARLVEEAGFEAAYLSGGAVARSMGLPDIGLVTLSEMIERARQVTGAVKIPIIADADAGYGSAVNLVRGVREFERTGVAAIHIEDQITPKRCGHLEGKEVISLAEMEKKLEAALASRTDPDLAIIARTDARAVRGLEEALERGRSFARMGADAVFIEAPEWEAELETIATSLPQVPLMVNLFKGGKTPLLPVSKVATDGIPTGHFSLRDPKSRHSCHAESPAASQRGGDDRGHGSGTHNFQGARPDCGS